jgi:hypothetical protein
MRGMRAAVLALAASTLAVGAIAASSATAARVAGTPGVRDSSAADILVYSAWGRQNDVTAAECTGTGPAQKVGALREHGTFRCRVAAEGKPGVVVATALGPEWLQVTTVVHGTLKPDPGIGQVPQGTPILESFWAGGKLQGSRFAKAHGVETVFCFGVGRFREIGQGGYQFFAYSCATIGAHGRRGAQLLVTAAGSDAIRVVRTLVP